MASSSPPSAPPGRGAGLVLVVDGAAGAARMIAAMREQLGVPVELARGREDALGWLGRRDLRLVVMDIGEAITERMALYDDFIKTPNNQTTRFLVLAPAPMLATAERMVQRPIDRVEIRPTSAGAFLRRVAHMLEQRERTELSGAHVRLYRVQGDDPFPIRVHLQNISSGGMFVVTQKLLTIGERYRVVLESPQLSAPVELTAVVRRKEQMGNDSGFGLQIESMHGGDVAGLRRLLAGDDAVPTAS